MAINLGFRKGTNGKASTAPLHFQNGLGEGLRTEPDKFWDELEIRILRSEAEALILYDPVFPADPFAH
jgi:hypothetical protein